MIPQAMVDKLVERGQPTGVLSLATIQSMVPLDSMTIEEIGDLTAHLEAAGVDVEIDKELLRAPSLITAPSAAMISNSTSPRFVTRPTPPAPALSMVKPAQNSPFNIRPSGLFVRRSCVVFFFLLVAMQLLAWAVIWLLV